MIITDINKLNNICEDASIFESGSIIKKLEIELKNSTTLGVGLSANQIGINKKIFIIRTPNLSLNFINPYLEKQYDQREFHREGCLSFPGINISTKRFNEIFIKDSLNPAGMIFTELEAVIIQHEIGHTQGKTMFDYKIKIPNRNDKCWCGERKYKKCHLNNIIRS